MLPYVMLPQLVGTVRLVVAAVTLEESPRVLLLFVILQRCYGGTREAAKLTRKARTEVEQADVAPQYGQGGKPGATFRAHNVRQRAVIRDFSEKKEKTSPITDNTG